MCKRASAKSPLSTLDTWSDFSAFIKFQMVTFRKAKTHDLLLISCQDAIAYMSITKIVANMFMYTHA